MRQHPSSVFLKPKTPDLLNLNDYKNVHPFVKTVFKETWETFALAGRLNYFLKNWDNFVNNPAILSIGQFKQNSGKTDGIRS